MRGRGTSSYLILFEHWGRDKDKFFLLSDEEKVSQINIDMSMYLSCVFEEIIIVNCIESIKLIN